MGALGSVTNSSFLYETLPMYYLKQGNFLNSTIELSSNLKPYDLLNKLQEIEMILGRKREIKNGPRTIDLDILCLLVF